MLFICYPKCSTCQKAKKWLTEHHVEYTERHIVEDNPSYEELKVWYEKSGLPLKRFFNTSGLLYKEMKLNEWGGAVKTFIHERNARKTPDSCRWQSNLCWIQRKRMGRFIIAIKFVVQFYLSLYSWKWYY